MLDMFKLVSYSKKARKKWSYQDRIVCVLLTDNLIQKLSQKYVT